MRNWREWSDEHELHELNELKDCQASAPLKLEGTMTDEELKAMSKDDANEKLSFDDKYRWVRLHNATANLYFVRRGQIKDVSPQGWWY